MNSSVVKMSLLAIAFKGVTSLSSLQADVLPEEFGLSLLQAAANKTTASAAKAELPAVWKIAMKPHETVEKMGSRVASLESRLKSVSKQHTTDVKVKKAEYEKTLETQAKENHRIEHSIGHFKAEVHVLKDDNAQLRSQAQGLMKRNNGLRAHLTKLMANMTTAHEFTETSLGDAQGKLHNATEISVLMELDKLDAVKNNEKANDRRLDEVGDSGELSLLELESGAVHRLHKRGNAMDLLEKMNNTLNELVKEQNASMFALKSNFDGMFDKATTRMTELLEQESTFNETKVNETVLNERLTTAVAHLGKVHKALQAQVESVRGFLAGLGTLKGKKQHAKEAAAEKAFLRAEERKEEARHNYEVKHEKIAEKKDKDSAKKASKLAVTLKKNLAHVGTHKVPAHTATSTHSSKSHKTSAHTAHHSTKTHSHAAGKKHHSHSSKMSLTQQDKPVSKHEASKKEDKKEDKKAKASKKAKKESVEDQMEEMIGENDEAAADTEEGDAEAKPDDAESEDGQGKGNWWSWMVR